MSLPVEGGGRTSEVGGGARRSQPAAQQGVKRTGPGGGFHWGGNRSMDDSPAYVGRALGTTDPKERKKLRQSKGNKGHLRAMTMFEDMSLGDARPTFYGADVWGQGYDKDDTRKLVGHITHAVEASAKFGGGIGPKYVTPDPSRPKPPLQDIGMCYEPPYLVQRDRVTGQTDWVPDVRALEDENHQSRQQIARLQEERHQLRQQIARLEAGGPQSFVSLDAGVHQLGKYFKPMCDLSMFVSMGSGRTSFLRYVHLQSQEQKLFMAGKPLQVDAHHVPPTADHVLEPLQDPEVGKRPGRTPAI
eukprot:COSAG01_NODE_348_length_18498_cov_181.563128_21_plen_302_part_00